MDGDNHSETEVTPATQSQGEFSKAAETSQERQNSHLQQMWLGHKNDHMQKQTNKQTKAQKATTTKKLNPGFIPSIHMTQPFWSENL